MSDNFDNWVVFLDALEVEVEDAHKRLDDNIFDTAVSEPWAPPNHLEALPLELLERAQKINSALNDLQLRTEIGRDHLREEIQRMNTLKTKNRKGSNTQYGQSVIPRYIDRAV